MERKRETEKRGELQRKGEKLANREKCNFALETFLFLRYTSLAWERLQCYAIIMLSQSTLVKNLVVSYPYIRLLWERVKS